MNFKDYNNPLAYPVRPTKPWISSRSPTKDELKDYQHKMEKYEADLPVYETNLEIYRKKSAECEELFWKDAFAEAGISQSHPKAGKLKELAYEHGHSSGYSEIFNHFIEFSELLS